MDGSCILLLIGVALILVGVLGLALAPPQASNDFYRFGIGMIVLGITLVAIPFVLDARRENNRRK